MDINTPRDAATSREHLKALDTLGTARTFFIMLALLALMVHVGAWVWVQFFNALAVPSASAPADADSSFASVLANHEAWISTALPLAEFVGRCSVILLCVTMLLAVLVNVSGRMGGVSDFITAFYLAIVVGAFFVPWDRLTPRDAGLPGVFTTLEQIKHHESALRGVAAESMARVRGHDLPIKSHDWELGFDAARFAGLPFIVALLLMTTGRRFTRGYRMASRSGSHDIPMKVV